MSDVPLIQLPGSESLALDPGALARLERFGGKKLLLEMIALFQAAAPERIAAASAGLASGDLSAVELALHSLKSSSGQLGAVRLGRLSEQGEALTRAGTLEGVAEIIREMELELVQVEAWLTAAREEGSA
jgi:HPt (histidine-containing phosphotransfer) domain-containing protein